MDRRHGHDYRGWKQGECGRDEWIGGMDTIGQKGSKEKGDWMSGEGGSKEISSVEGKCRGFRQR